MDSISRLADLIAKRNLIDREISGLINRPATQGHIGEFIAAKIFDIELMPSANNKAIDGYFRSGSLAGKSVDIKFYGKQESLLDIKESAQPDYFFVLTGPKGSAASSKGACRLCVIERAYLFEGQRLAIEIANRGTKFGCAASVRAELWEAAEIYPNQRCGALLISAEQRALLEMFGGNSDRSLSR